MENNWKEEINKLIEKYYNEYKLPEMGITDAEWDALLDNLSKHLNNNDMATAINIIVRKTLNLSMTDDVESVGLYHVISALPDLMVLNLSEDVIKDLQNKIMLDALINKINKKNRITK